MPLWVHVQNASGLSSVEGRAHGTVKNDPDTGGNLERSEQRLTAWGVNVSGDHTRSSVIRIIDCTMSTRHRHGLTPMPIVGLTGRAPGP